LTLKGRTFKGLRGFAGKPFHPPFTDFPVAGYVMGAVFDVISAVGGPKHPWAQDFFHAGTFVFIAGGVVSVLAALTGWWDWRQSSKPGNQARRTVNTHAVIMISVTVLAVVDIGWRLNRYHTVVCAPVGLAVLSVVVAALVSVGATFGGSLVFDYGFNVETAGDHPVWHQSEEDVFPGEY
jgi:uncharacterized membrane protein